MVLSREETLIHDVKISTVGPGYVSGEGAVQELTDMDLAMKLHYIRIVYYFKRQAFEGLTIIDIKETMFYWLNHAYIPCGRLRKSESGRPYVKCNDCGVRLIEARCKMSLDEWLEASDDATHKLVVPSQVLGPDLFYSPLVLIQLTKFKCGGTAVGVSWSHLLGDGFSLAGFINLWGQATRKQYPTHPLCMAQSNKEYINTKCLIKDSYATKRVGPVGDLWATSNEKNMETYSFYVPGHKLRDWQSKICGEKNQQQPSPFESICTVVWKCVATVKHRSEVKVVTICKNDKKRSFEGVITNMAQTIKVVKSNSPVQESSLMELGLLIMNQTADDQNNIGVAMGSENEFPDLLVYGGNLTFVELSDAPFYELDIRGETPIYVNCAIDSIGDEGVVLVLPARKDDSDGMKVCVTLPENEISELRLVLKNECSLF